MDIYCTRPGCPRPVNPFPDLDHSHTLKTVQQKFCTTCGMPLILIGRYLPLKLLGRGGFGAAFLARDRYTPAMRQCVVKQFQPAGDLTPAQRQLAQELFEREGEVLEQLGNAHPQIPDLFAFFSLALPGQQPGNQTEFFYLVQEFIDGQSLEEKLAQQGHLEEAEVLEMLEEVLEVLQFVHENGSIHRDIKPSNIMHHRNGRYYLLDFGAVKQVANAAAGNVQSSTGIYSMGYAPPEQMSSSTVFPSTDLYALAVTSITLLTGKSPSDLLDPYNNRWNWRPYAQVSDRLAIVLDKMLLPTPKQRFQSAVEVKAALVPSGIARKPTSPPPNAPGRFPIATPYPQAPQQIPAPVQTPPVPMVQTASQAAPPISAPPPAPLPVVAPASPPMAPAPPARRPASVSRFTTLEILLGAAFIGFEGSLVAIALLSLLKPSPLSFGLAMVVLGGLVFSQFQRLIEGKDLPILAGLTLALFWIFSPLGGGYPLTTVLLIAGVMALVAVAITTLFRLVYNLLSNFL